MNPNPNSSRSRQFKVMCLTGVCCGVLAAIGMLGLAMNTPPDIVVFVGRFHPMLVHLPIGFIVLLSGIELIALWPRFKNANASAGFVLALAVPAAIVSVACGWLLSLGSHYNAGLLAIHRWAGVSTAALCTITAVCHWCRRKRGYHIGLVATACAMTVAGHVGASLTHGSNYLFEHAPAPLRSLFIRTTTVQEKLILPEIADRRVYTGVVQPILREKCLTCHNPRQSKGVLRFDNIQGGEDRDVVVPGNAAESELVKRLHLPLDDKNHMPPAGEPQLSAKEIALLEWWIDAGAPMDTKIRDLPSSAAVQGMLYHVAAAPKQP